MKAARSRSAAMAGVYFAASTTSTQFPMEGAGYRQNLQGGLDMIVGMMDMTRFGTASLLYFHLSRRIGYRRSP